MSNSLLVDQVGVCVWRSIASIQFVLTSTLTVFESVSNAKVWDDVQSALTQVQNSSDIDGTVSSFFQAGAE